MLRLERCSERPKAVIPIHPLLQTWNPMPSCSAPPCTAPRTTRLLVYTEACARILPTFPLKCPTLMMPRMLGLSERRRHGIWLHASQNPASPDSRAWFRSQSDTEFLLFFHTPHHNPYPQVPCLSLPPPPLPLHASWASQRCKEEVEVRTQRPGPRGFPASAGVPTAQPPEHCRPDPASADAPPPPPPPISGVQGRGRLGSAAARPRAGTGGDGRGTDRRAAPAAARIHPARLPRAPARPRGARGAGERAACRWRPGPPRSAPTRPRAGVRAPGKMVSWMISRAVV